MTIKVRLSLREKFQIFKKSVKTYLNFPKSIHNLYLRELQKVQYRVDTAVQNGATLKAIASNKGRTQDRYNHRKGGSGINGIITGQGDDPQYAVIKHQFANGDYHINCLRCGKKWRPGQPNYEEALKFNTRNVSSGSIQFAWSDNGALHRELLKNS